LHLTVKLNKNWGGRAGWEILLNLHHSFLVSQATCAVPSPSPCWGPAAEAAAKSPPASRHPMVVPALPELSELALLYLLPLLFPPNLHFLFKFSQSGFLGVEEG